MLQELQLLFLCVVCSLERLHVAPHIFRSGYLRGLG